MLCYRASFAGQVPYTSSSATAQLKVEDNTYLQYVGPSNGYYYTTEPVSATLYDKFTGKPIINDPEQINFDVDGASVEPMSGNNGTAIGDLQLTVPPGSYTMIVTFSGDGEYMPSEVKEPFKVLNSVNTVTGNGTAAGDTFNLAVQYKAGGKAPTGSFTWKDTTQNVSFSSTSLVGLGVMGNYAFIGGKGTVAGKSGTYTFLVTAVAGGAGSGQITVQIAGKGLNYTQSGQLTAGSITIQ